MFKLLKINILYIIFVLNFLLIKNLIFSFFINYKFLCITNYIKFLLIKKIINKIFLFFFIIKIYKINFNYKKNYNYINEIIQGINIYFIFIFSIQIFNHFWVKLLNKLSYNKIKFIIPQKYLMIYYKSNFGLLILFNIIISLFLSPLIEEILFKLIIYNNLKKNINKIKVSLIVNTLFALLHFNIKSFFPIFILGIFSTYIYEKKEYILSSIIIHILFNLCSFIFIFIIINK